MYGWFIIQYLIQLTAHISINISTFVVLLLHVLAITGHILGGHLQSYMSMINAVQDVHIYEINIQCYQLKCH